jgi:hypothetical protein
MPVWEATIFGVPWSESNVLYDVQKTRHGKRCQQEMSVREDTIFWFPGAETNMLRDV